jgi:ABC-type polysaccharide/polyol phosphate export permease
MHLASQDRAVFDSPSITDFFLYSLGLLWPIEAQPILLKTLSYYCPTTTSLTAFREILYKKTDRFAQTWIEAYVICLAWIMLTIILSMILIKYRK